MTSNKVIVAWLKPLLTITACCSATFAKHDLNLSPKNVVACTTQTFNFTCILSGSPEQPIPNATLGFGILKDRDFVSVDDKQVFVINETMSMFEYTVSPGGTYHYIKCFYGNSSSSRLEQSLTASITVYTMPIEVTDFNCVVDNYVTSMECTLSYGIKYKALPDVVFQWKPDRMERWQNCSNLKAEDGICSWRSPRAAGDFTMKEISVNITLEHPCGRKAHSIFHVDTSKIVKPKPVSDLLATVLNSTCIQVDWKTTDARPEYPKQHLVDISSKWENRNKTFLTEQDVEAVNDTFYDLNPNTMYTISVCMKPAEGGYCSDYRSVSAKTYTAKPSSSPQVAPGGYSWHFKDCEGRKNERIVCLLLKPIKEKDWNSDTGNVRVEVDNATMEWPGNATFGCFLLPCRTNHTVFIRAENNNGSSESASIINVLSASSGIDRPEFIVEMSHTVNSTTSVYVRLLDISTVHQNGYTVFLCRKALGQCNKTSPPKWRSSNETDLILNNINSPEDYLFGVSMTSQHGGSGVEWQSCIYTKDSTPARAPKNVHVEPGPEDMTLVITWDKLACRPGDPFISSYSVQYCVSPHDRSCKNVTVPAIGKSRFVLKGLIKGKTYDVTVSAISKDQREGPKSKPKKGIPEDNSLPIPLPVIIVVVVVIVALITIGLLIGCTKCGKKLSRRIRDARRVTLPSAPALENFPHDVSDEPVAHYTGSAVSIHRNINDDSGYPQSDFLPYTDAEQTYPLVSPGHDDNMSERWYASVDDSSGHIYSSLERETHEPLVTGEEAEMSQQSLTDTGGNALEGNRSIAESLHGRVTSSSNAENDTDGIRMTNSHAFTEPVIDYVKAGEDDTWTGSDLPERISDQMHIRDQKHKSVCLENASIASEALNGTDKSRKMAQNDAVIIRSSNSHAFSGPESFDYVKAGEDDIWTMSELSEGISDQMHTSDQMHKSDCLESTSIVADTLNDRDTSSKMIQNDTVIDSSSTNCHAFSNPGNFDYVKAGGDDPWTPSDLFRLLSDQIHTSEILEDTSNASETLSDRDESSKMAKNDIDASSLNDLREFNGSVDNTCIESAISELISDQVQTMDCPENTSGASETLYDRNTKSTIIAQNGTGGNSFTNSHTSNEPVNVNYVKAGEDDPWTPSDFSRLINDQIHMSDYLENTSDASETLDDTDESRQMAYNDIDANNLTNSREFSGAEDNTCAESAISELNNDQNQTSACPENTSSASEILFDRNTGSPIAHYDTSVRSLSNSLEFNGPVNNTCAESETFKLKNNQIQMSVCPENTSSASDILYDRNASSPMAQNDTGDSSFTNFHTFNGPVAYVKAGEDDPWTMADLPEYEENN